MISWCWLVLVLHSASQAPPPAQAPAPDAKFQAYVSVDFTKSRTAQSWEFTPSATYDVNDYWSIEVGAPLYLVNGALSGDGASHVGIGDVYGSVSLDASTDAVTFYSTLSVSAPTGNYDNGLGAGQATYEWTNHIGRDFGRVTPYAEAGLANAIDAASGGGSIGRLRGRPVIAVGNLFQGEAGLDVAVSDAVSASVSAYLIHPVGASTGVVTRRVPGHPQAGPPESVINVADLERDRGLSASIDASLTAALDVTLWFWRSTTFHYDTASVNLALNLSALGTTKAARRPPGK